MVITRIRKAISTYALAEDNSVRRCLLCGELTYWVLWPYRPPVEKDCGASLMLMNTTDDRLPHPFLCVSMVALSIVCRATRNHPAADSVS